MPLSSVYLFASWLSKVSFLGTFPGTFRRFIFKVLFQVLFSRYFPQVQEFRSMLAMEDEGGPGWSTMSSMCNPSTSLGWREEKWGGEDQWLNFRIFLGSFPFYRSRRWRLRRWRRARLVCYGVNVQTFNLSWKKGWEMGARRISCWILGTF